MEDRGGIVKKLATNEKKVFRDLTRLHDALEMNFDEPKLCKKLTSVLKSYEFNSNLERNINKAIKLFTKVVVRNEKRLNPKIMFQVLRVYGNILLHSKGKKTRLKKHLHELSHYINIADNEITLVWKKSYRGKYGRCWRSGAGDSKINGANIKETVRLLKVLLKGNLSKQKTYIGVYRFIKKTKAMEPRGSCLFTGIMSSLKPDLFIVRNKRTKYISTLISDYEYGKIIGKGKLSEYLKFNEIFHYIADECEINSLRELDIACGKIYENR